MKGVGLMKREVKFLIFVSSQGSFLCEIVEENLGDVFIFPMPHYELLNHSMNQWLK